MVNNQRRKLLKHAAIVSGGSLLAGCSGGSGQSSSGNTVNGDNSGPTTEGSQYNWVHDQSQKPAEKLIVGNLNALSGDPAIASHYKRYEEKYNIKVKAKEIPESDTLAKARTLLQSQSATPDLYEMLESWVYDLAAKGYFEKVGNHITTTDAWSDVMVEACTLPLDLPTFSDFPYPEGIYAVPQYANGWTLFANEDVLEEAGLSRDFSPKTFQETLDACEKMKDVTKNPMLFPFDIPGSGTPVVFNLAQRAGGHLFDEKNNPDFMNDGFVKTLDFLLTLVNKGYAPQGVTSFAEGNVAQPFYNGDAGFMIAATVQLFLKPKDLPIDKPAHEIAHIDVLPKPKGTGDTATGNANIVMYPLSVFSHHKKAGVKFQDLVTSKEAQKNELIKEGNMPIRPDVFEMNEVKNQIPYYDVLKEYVAGLDKFIYPNSSRVNQIVFSTMTNAFSNGWSAEKTAKTMQSKVENI